MSARTMTNKQLIVLELLRHRDGAMTVNEVADAISEQTPCGQCQGTGEGDHRRYDGSVVCEKCWGRGHAYFHYSDAYQALQALRKKGLVTRRCKRDEWGDELPVHLYSAALRKAVGAVVDLVEGMASASAWKGDVND